MDVQSGEEKEEMERDRTVRMDVWNVILQSAAEAEARPRGGDGYQPVRPAQDGCFSGGQARKKKGKGMYDSVD